MSHKIREAKMPLEIKSIKILRSLSEKQRERK